MLAFSSDQECPFEVNFPIAHTYHALVHVAEYLWRTQTESLSHETFCKMLPMTTSMAHQLLTDTDSTGPDQTNPPWNVRMLDMRSSVPTVLLYRSTPTGPLYCWYRQRVQVNLDVMLLRHLLLLNFITVSFQKIRAGIQLCLKAFGYSFKCICAS